LRSELANDTIYEPAPMTFLLDSQLVEKAHDRLFEPHTGIPELL
jgi:hypothetical protein